MTDIVERLRNYWDGKSYGDVSRDVAKAADEIERLRGALQEIKFRINNMPKDMQLTPDSAIFDLIKMQIRKTEND